MSTPNHTTSNNRNNRRPGSPQGNPNARGPKKNRGKYNPHQQRAPRAPANHADTHADNRPVEPIDAETAPITETIATPGVSLFSELALSPQILRAVRDEGYQTPTPIQSQAIPPALDGRDILGCAQTGTGKTAAFALPILHKLHEAGVANDRGYHYARALILSPTRELAGQITDSFATYGRHTRLRHTAIYGGVSQHRQEKALGRGVDILVATPGRLMDLIDQGIIDLCEVEMFVLDEADRMLDMGFIHPIRKIAAMLPTDRQTMLFSATMPREIKALADSLLTNPVRVTVTPVASAAPLIEQSVYMVGRDQKQSLLHHLIGEHEIERTLVFTRTKHGADKVTRRLNLAGIAADSIHGNKSQSQRQRALDGFRAGKSRVLVATDVAARGLDIDDISHVFNFDLPHEPEAYIHRIGRTGRAGATGAAIAFCDQEERPLLRQIERLTGKPITAVAPLPDLPKLAALMPGEPDGERRESQSASGASQPRPAARRSATPGRGQPGKPSYGKPSYAKSGKAAGGRGKPHPRAR